MCELVSPGEQVDVAQLIPGHDVSHVGAVGAHSAQRGDGGLAVELTQLQQNKQSLKMLIGYILEGIIVRKKNTHCLIL